MTTSSHIGPPTFCQWEVWQAEWDHEDGTTKARPVLILSSTASAQANTHIWVAKFTKTFSQIPFRIEFNNSDASFAETGLTDTCYLYVAETRRIPKTKFIRKRGKLSTLSAVVVAFTIKQALKFQP
jgi:mRNA-degrading endonuclease toxin of MazEF toxin-antitoxin module